MPPEQSGPSRPWSRGTSVAAPARPRPSAARPSTQPSQQLAARKGGRLGYPRPAPVRALRTLARRAPLLLLAYPLAAVAHLALLAQKGGVAALRAPTTYVNAAWLREGLLWAITYPVEAAVPALVVANLIMLRQVARRDERQEQSFLTQRILDERLTQTTMAVVRPLTSRPAVRATQPPRAERMPQDASVATSDPSGPPDDLRRLFEPAVFVGRVAELTWLAERLRAGGTLAVTDATGAGGVGTSTLVARALRAARAEGRFAGGVALVPCEGRRDVTDIVKAALARFDPQRRQPEQSDALSLAAIAGALLREQDAAIVLEDLGPQVPLADVLRPLAETGVTVIVTARAAVRGLRVDQQLAVGPLTADDAIALFTDTFERGAAAGLLGQAKPTVVERIANALARHPMAIALIAAYAAEERRTLATLAEDLQADPRSGLGLPADDVPAALALALETAVGRLPEAARALFAALGAFGGLDAGRSALLMAAEALEIDRAGEALRRLVRRGLVRELADQDVPVPGDPDRLLPHPVVRALAAEALGKLPQEAQGAILFAIATYFAESLAGAPDAAIEPDEANIQAALEWAHANAQVALEVAICDRMRHYWRDRGRVAAGLRYLPWGVAAAANRARATGAREDRLREADLALSSGEMLRTAGKLEEAERVFKQNLALRQELGDGRGAGLALIHLGELAQARDEIAVAEIHFDQALIALRSTGAGREAAICLAWLGRIALGQNRLDAAAQAYAEALLLDEEVGDRPGTAQDLSTLGQIALRQGQYGEAERYLQQALALRRELGDRHGEAIELYQLGQVAYQRGVYAEAERYYEASLELRRAVRDLPGEGITLAQLGRVAAHMGDTARAETFYRQGLKGLLEAQDAHNYAAVALRAGTFFAEQTGSREEGAVLLQQAIELYHQMGAPEEQQARAAAARLGY